MKLSLITISILILNLFPDKPPHEEFEELLERFVTNLSILITNSFAFRATLIALTAILLLRQIRHILKKKQDKINIPSFTKLNSDKLNSWKGLITLGETYLVLSDLKVTLEAECKIYKQYSSCLGEVRSLLNTYHRVLSNTDLTQEQKQIELNRITKATLDILEKLQTLLYYKV